MFMWKSLLLVSLLGFTGSVSAKASAAPLDYVEVKSGTMFRDSAASSFGCVASPTFSASPDLSFGNERATLVLDDMVEGKGTFKHDFEVFGPSDATIYYDFVDRLKMDGEDEEYAETPHFVLSGSEIVPRFQTLYPAKPLSPFVRYGGNQGLDFQQRMSYFESSKQTIFRHDVEVSSDDPCFFIAASAALTVFYGEMNVYNRGDRYVLYPQDGHLSFTYYSLLDITEIEFYDAANKDNSFKSVDTRTDVAAMVGEIASSIGWNSRNLVRYFSTSSSSFYHIRKSDLEEYRYDRDPTDLFVRRATISVSLTNKPLQRFSIWREGRLGEQIYSSDSYAYRTLYASFSPIINTASSDASYSKVTFRLEVANPNPEYVIGGLSKESENLYVSYGPVSVNLSISPVQKITGNSTEMSLGILCGVLVPFSFIFALPSAFAGSPMFLFGTLIGAGIALIGFALVFFPKLLFKKKRLL